MSEKTEQPTAKRLRDAREKGQVCKSQEVGTTLSLLALFGCFIAAGPFFWQLLQVMFEAPMAHMNEPFQVGLFRALRTIALAALQIVGIVLGVAIVAGLAGNIIQIGILISPKAAMPKMDKLNPMQCVKKTFSVKNLVELLKTIIKMLIIGVIVKNTIEDHLGMLISMPQAGIHAIAPVVGSIFTALFLNTAPAFVVVSAIDYFFQRFQYIKGLKMTKDEVKREYKEMEGDPVIKGKRKQLHQEMAMSNTLQNVRRASVVVTNPTHVAVALMYDEDKTPLPIVLGMGEGLLAKRIVEVAREEGIPIMQNVPLARALLADGVENEYIPADLIRPVAEVLRWAQKLQNGS